MGRRGYLEGLEDRRLLAGFTFDLAPGSGSVTFEGGLKVVSVTPNATIDFDANLTSDPADSIQGFQLNFGPSNDELAIADWSFGPSGWLPADGTLNTTVDDVLVGGVVFSSVSVNDSALTLGSFRVTAPSSDGDYRISLDAGPTFDNSGVTTTAGLPGLIEDYGDVIIRIGAGGPNRAPFASDDSFSTGVDQPLLILAGDLLANDTDPDADVLSVVSTTPPSRGTLSDNQDGTFTFTPEAGFSGNATFTYTITDGRGMTDSALVTVQVSGGNADPVAVDDSLSTTPGASLNLSVPNDLLGNDTDSDGDTLVLIDFTDPVNGVLTDNGNRTLTYTPNAGFTGSDSFQYTISDGNGGTDVATVTIDVTPDGDTGFTFNLVPGSGVVTFEGGTKVVTVDAAATIDFSFEVTAQPDTGVSGFQLNFTNTHDALGVSSWAFGPGGWLPADASLNTAANDNSVGGATFSLITITSAPSVLGTFQVTAPAAGGDFLLTTAGISGFAATGITLAPSGIAGEILDYGNVIIRIEGGNTEPNAVNDSVSTDQDMALLISAASLLANDTDPDGDSLALASTTNPSQGSLVNNGNGTLTYTPSSGFSGADSFRYTVSDGRGGTDTATVSVSVNPVGVEGLSLELVPDSGVVSYEGGTKVVTVSAGANLGFVVEMTSNPSAGLSGFQLNFTNTHDALAATTWTFGAGGWLPADASLNTAIDDNSVGGATFSPINVGAAPLQLGSLQVMAPVAGGDYLLTMAGVSGFSATGVTLASGVPGLILDHGDVIIRVSDSSNNPPAASDDALSVEEGGSLVISVAADLLSNDVDPDGDAISLSSFTAPANGVLTSNGNVTLTYTPNPGFLGQDSFTYTISDGRGGVDTATVEITVNAMSNDGFFFDLLSQAGDVTFENGAKVVTISAGQALGFTAHLTAIPADNINGFQLNFDQSHSALQISTWTFGPSGWLPADGSLDTDANDNGVGGALFGLVPVSDTPVSLGTFVVDVPAVPGDYVLTINGGAGFSATGLTTEFGDGRILEYGDVIIRSSEVLLPNPVDDQYQTIEETPLNIVGSDLLANDTDPDGDPLTLVNVDQPTNGTLVDNGDGSYTYTPNTNFDQTDSFTYTISNGNNSAVGTVFINVSGTQDPPTATGDVLTVLEDNALEITIAADLLSNDTDPDTGDQLTLVSNTSTTNGTLTDNGDGTLTYLPNPQFSGPDSFSYTISDGNGATDSATVSIVVEFENDAPIAGDDGVFSIDENSSLTLNIDDLLANDTDEEGDPLSLTGLGQPSNGTVVNNGDGTITYTPNPNFISTDTFTYTVSDGNSTDTGTVTIVVNNVNLIPQPRPDQFNLVEDTSLLINVALDLLANDIDPDGDPLVFLSAADPVGGAIVDNGDGTLTYTPALDATGTDTFTYTVTDQLGATAAATVTIVLSPVEDPPRAMDDLFTTQEDQPLTIALADLLANDVEPDGDPLILITTTDVGALGSVRDNGDGTVTYTPPQDFFGDDRFSYFVSDGKGNTSAATVTVSVTPVSDPPTAAADQLSAVEDQSSIIAISTLLDNDSDADGDAISFVSLTQPANGQLNDNGDGTYTYTPNQDFDATDTFTYSITDGSETSVGTVSIVIDPVNDDPTAVADTLTTNEDTTLQISLIDDLFANDIDADGDAFFFASFTGAVEGTVINNGDGTLTYVPARNFNGLDSFTYTIRDESLVSSTASVTIEVLSVNDPPVAVDDNLSSVEDQTLIVLVSELTGNDLDADNDTLLIVAMTPPQNGALVDNGDDSYTYSPNPDFAGVDQFSYTISDGQNGTATASVSISVAPRNDAPMAVDDALSLNEDSDLLIIVAQDLFANDSDADGDPLRLVSVTATSHGALVNNQDGSLAYTPDANYAGADSFSYTVSDGNGETGTATVAITVQSINDLPTAEDDALRTAEDTPLRIVVATDLFGNDRDADGQLTLVAVTNPRNGVLQDNQDGSYTYTPNPNFSGADGFSYTATDGDGAQASATVSITIDSVNDPPLAEDDSYNMTQFATLVEPALTGLLANDSDVEGGQLLLTIVDGADYGRLELQLDGSFSYQPNQIFWGVETFTYMLDDGQDTDTATVTIKVAALTPWRNPINPLDVNNDGKVEPLDALQVINKINRDGAIKGLPFPQDGDPEPPPFVDTNGDNNMFPDDVLKVINYLNSVGVSEGEAAPASLPGSAPASSSARAVDALFAEVGEAAAEGTSASNANLQDGVGTGVISRIIDVQDLVAPRRINHLSSSAVYRSLGTAKSMDGEVLEDLDLRDLLI